MKRIAVASLIACSVALGLSSCTKTSTPVTNLPVVPSSDSVSNGSYLQIYFGSKSFYVKDLAVAKSVVHSLYIKTAASDASNMKFIGQMQVTDHLRKMVSINITATNDTSLSGTGIGQYTLVTNTSTLTDYSDGENKTYSIMIPDSYFTVDSIGLYYEGSFYFNMNYNNQGVGAYGTYKIAK